MPENELQPMEADDDCHQSRNQRAPESEGQQSEATRTRLVELLDSLGSEWTPVDSADNVPLYLLCGAGLAELQFSGRAWSSQSALDFEATACGVWIDTDRKSILPDEIRRVVPAWGGLAVAVQLNVPVEARLTSHGKTCKRELRDTGPELFLEYFCRHPIRGRVTVRLLGNEGPAPGAVKADNVTGEIVKVLQDIAQSHRTLAAASGGQGLAGGGQTARPAGMTVGNGVPDKATAPATETVKPKRSTERGEGYAKLVAAPTKHHKYADGGCLNLEPIGNNELARLAGVAESTASEFFKKQFHGFRQYRNCCTDAKRLVAVLKLLNQEYSPYHLCGAKPPSEREREDDE